MTEKSADPVHEIKKYPNRRFYDVTRSRHVTLDELYALVKAGHRIRVADSRTGADITNVVLTQIILEHDPPKLDLFPSSLLHQAIQANQQMVRRFVEEYFDQALRAFSESRKTFDEFLRRSGFSALQPMAPFDWVRMLFPGAGRAADRPGEVAAAGPADESRENVDALREELEALRADLAELRTRKGKTRSSRRRR